MNCRVSLMLLAAVTFLAPVAVYANTTETVVKAQNKSDFSAVVAAVHQQMAPGGHWEFVSSTERADINQTFGEMQGLFDKYDSVDKMDSGSKVKLYADQQRVNDILTRKDSRRQVCKSEQPIGSLIPKRTCRSFGTIERDRENAQQFMQTKGAPSSTAGH